MEGRELFFELFSGLPRQGPGDSESTRRALALVPPLSRESRILDIGCGTGTQTLELARHTPASVVAVDFHAPFVEELARTAARLGLGDRVQACVGDMAHLGFPPRSFDLVWSEGAIFAIGFDAGLVAWRDLLRPGGHLAVSELCWFRPDPPRECADFFASEYPAMRDVAANREAAVRAGYELVGDFLLPSSAWWTDYYEPLGRNIEAFSARHAGEGEAEVVDRAGDRDVSPLFGLVRVRVLRDAEGRRLRSGRRHVTPSRFPPTPSPAPSPPAPRSHKSTAADSPPRSSGRATRR